MTPSNVNLSNNWFIWALLTVCLFIFLVLYGLSSRRRYTSGKTKEPWWLVSIQTGNQTYNHIIWYYFISHISWGDYFCIQRCGSAVSVAAGVEPAVNRYKEAWSENNPAHVPSCGPSPVYKPAASPPSKPIRTEPSSPVAPPPHCIQGALRHPDFQHNGERLISIIISGLQQIIISGLLFDKMLTDQNIYQQKFDNWWLIDNDIGGVTSYFCCLC